MNGENLCTQIIFLDIGMPHANLNSCFKWQNFVSEWKKIDSVW